MESKISSAVVNRLNITKPDLTEKSLKVYVDNLFRLNDNQKIMNLRFLKNKEQIMNKIKHKKLSTQRNYYFAVITVLQPMIGNDNYKALFDFYNEKLKECMNGVTEESKTRTLKGTLKDIHTKAEELRKQVLETPNEKLNWKDARSAVIANLFSLIQPRRALDYIDMFINSSSNDKNSLDLDKKEFIFRNYKTAGKYGPQIIKIPDALVELINKYLSVYPLDGTKTDKPFLLSDRKIQLSKTNGLTFLLNKIFGFSVSSIRHIVITEEEGTELKEAEKRASDRGHSINASVGYIQHVK